MIFTKSREWPTWINKGVFQNHHNVRKRVSAKKKKKIYWNNWCWLTQNSGGVIKDDVGDDANAPKDDYDVNNNEATVKIKMMRKLILTVLIPNESNTIQGDDDKKDMQLDQHQRPTDGSVFERPGVRVIMMKRQSLPDRQEKTRRPPWVMWQPSLNQFKPTIVGACQAWNMTPLWQYCREWSSFLGLSCSAVALGLGACHSVSACLALA